MADEAVRTMPPAAPARSERPAAWRRAIALDEICGTAHSQEPPASCGQECRAATIMAA